MWRTVILSQQKEMRDSLRLLLLRLLLLLPLLDLCQGGLHRGSHALLRLRLLHPGPASASSFLLLVVVLLLLQVHLLFLPLQQQLHWIVEPAAPTQWRLQRLLGTPSQPLPQLRHR